MVIFIWKIAMGLVDGYSLQFRNERMRTGQECVVEEIIQSSPVTVRRVRENSLSGKGAKMFNLLASELRNISSDKVQHIKTKLDTFLMKVPNQPTSANEGWAAESNCLLHQIPLSRSVNQH